LRLFCLPYAGAGAALYRPWAALVPDGVELCPVLLPGREGRHREAPHTDLCELAVVLADALDGWLDRPFALFGHSMGAWIAFELAREARRRGYEPAHLFVSGRPAPQLVVSEAPIHALPDEAFVEAVGQRYGAIPDVIRNDPDLLRLFLPTLRADLTMIERYVYRSEAPLTVPITAFGGTHDPRADRAQLEAWREQTIDRFDLQMHPGDHFFIRTGREALLVDLSAALLATVGRRRA
jgi:surfactin synthase thioesterase subunit